MAVKDIYSEGGNLPTPEQIKSERTPEADPIRAIEEAHYRGERLKAFKQGAGMTDNPPPANPTTRTEEKLGINVGDIIKAQADMLTTMMTTMMAKASELQTKSPNDPFFQYLVQEIKDLKGKHEAEPTDPLAVISAFDQIANVMKKHLGSPEGIKVTGSDINALMELERLKMESADRQRQWQEEIEERRAGREMEMIRWQDETRLRWAEFKGKRESRDKAMGELSDLAGAIIEGMEGGGGGVSRGVAVKCPTCGEHLKVRPGTKTVECSTCGERHEVNWGEKVPAKAPAARPLKTNPEAQVEDEEE